MHNMHNLGCLLFIICVKFNGDKNCNSYGVHIHHCNLNFIKLGGFHELCPTTIVSKICRSFFSKSSSTRLNKWSLMYISKIYTFLRDFVHFWNCFYSTLIIFLVAIALFMKKKFTFLQMGREFFFVLFCSTWTFKHTPVVLVSFSPTRQLQFTTNFDSRLRPCEQKPEKVVKETEGEITPWREQESTNHVFNIY